MTRPKDSPPKTCADCGKEICWGSLRCRSCASRSMQVPKRLQRIPPNPSGLCMCGCGEPTPIAPQSSKKQGWVLGEPVRFIRGHQHRKPGIPDYIEEDHGYVTPCWAWQRSKSEMGYGTAVIGSRRYPAHRVMYERLRGPIPDGLELDHLCRSPSCVNPDHMEAVTHTENVRRGPNIKLNEQAVREIRTITETNMKRLTEIAAGYGIKLGTLYNVRYRRSWKDVA